MTGTMTSRLLAGTAATVGLGAGTLVYSYAYERNAYTLRQADVPVLPAGSAPLRVLHLSDLHLDPSRTKMISWVRRLADLRPDLVIATGDFFTSPASIASVLEACEPLFAFPGMFIPGNADYFAPVPKSPSRYITRRPKHGVPLPWPQLAAALASAGWLDLTNVRSVAQIAGLRIEARGVDDPYLRKDRYHRVAGPVGPGADLSLGLLHAPEPRVLNAMTADGVNLILGGHTHGGQVRIPGYGALVTNCNLDRARARGLHDNTFDGRRSWLHVSGGLGTSPYVPIRFCCRPEATLLTLSDKAASMASGRR